jgi:beta-lactamase superfamily II metal-dependent hydrolase
MKKQVLLLLLVLAACKPEIKPGGDFFGTIAEESIASGWEQDARISVFDANSGNSEYVYAGAAHEKSGKFTVKELNTDGIGLPGRYGVYPYFSSTIVTNSGVIYLDLPQVQEGVPGKPGHGSAVMVACSSDNNLVFKDLCGALVLRFSGSEEKIAKVTISGHGNEVLSGKGTVNLDETGVPSASFASGPGSLTFRCTSPVEIGAGKEIWFMLPPVTFSNGLSVSVEDAYGRVCALEIGTPVSVARGEIRRVTAGEVKYSSPDKVTVGAPLPAWEEGWLDIHSINGGRGESFYYIFPDGTTMLVDAAGAPDFEIEGASGSGIYSRPSQQYSSGSVIVKYLQHFAPAAADGKIDYMMVSHYHSDHMGSYTSGFGKYGWKVVDRNGTITPAINLDAGGFLLNGLPEVGMSFPIIKLIDRGDWDNRASSAWESGKGRRQNYYNFIDWTTRVNGTVREKLAVGHTDQIVLKHDAAAYPQFSVRGIAANGDIWTGSGTNVNTTYVPSAADCLANLSTYDINENIFSCVFTLSYGKFDWFAGGDIQYNDYTKYSWKDIEKPISKVVSKVEAMKANHHCTNNTNSTALVSALKPDNLIVGVWTQNHPTEATLKRFFTASPDLRVFTTNMSENLKTTLKYAGYYPSRFDATGGHVVLRVKPGGDSYYIYVLDDSDFEYRVASAYGPFECK